MSRTIRLGMTGASAVFLLVCLISGLLPQFFVGFGTADPDCSVAIEVLGEVRVYFNHYNVHPDYCGAFVEEMMKDADVSANLLLYVVSDAPQSPVVCSVDFWDGSRIEAVVLDKSLTQAVCGGLLGEQVIT